MKNLTIKKELEVRFNELLNSATDISNDINWDEARNGTEYYDDLVNTELPEGKLFKAIDPADDRRILLVGRGKRSDIIFERYTYDGTNFMLTSNLTSTSRRYIGDHSGYYTKNIIDKLISYKVVDTSSMDSIELMRHKINLSIDRSQNVIDSGISSIAWEHMNLEISIRQILERSKKEAQKL